MVRTYRKKPVEVQAIRLGPENAGEIVEWINSHYHETVAGMRGGPKGGSRNATIYIDTLEGTMVVEVGDWVIRGVQHEFYPCKPGIFEATYELVPERMSEEE